MLGDPIPVQIDPGVRVEAAARYEAITAGAVGHDTRELALDDDRAARVALAAQCAVCRAAEKVARRHVVTGYDAHGRHLEDLWCVTCVLL